MPVEWHRARRRQVRGERHRELKPATEPHTMTAGLTPRSEPLVAYPLAAFPDELRVEEESSRKATATVRSHRSKPDSSRESYPLLRSCSQAAFGFQLLHCLA